MKCVCGYECNKNQDFDVQVGDEEFIKINGSFHIESSYRDEIRVDLYACPKCGLVQMKK